MSVQQASFIDKQLQPSKYDDFMKAAGRVPEAIPETVPVSMPQPVLEGTMLLGSLGSQAYQIVNPLAVSFEQIEGEFVTCAVGLDEFGYGETLHDSIVDLQRIIISLYEMLTSDKDNLGPDLQRVFNSLDSAIEPKYADKT